MSEVSDQANILASKIRNSKEFKEFKEIKNAIMAVPGLKEKVDEFEKTRYEQQLLQMRGEEQSQYKLQLLQDLYAELMQNPDVEIYFKKEVEFNLMIANVNKVIGESIKDVI